MEVYIIADNDFISYRGVKSIIEDLKKGASVLQSKNRVDLQNKLKEHPNAYVILDYTQFDFISLEQMLIVKSNASESKWLLLSNDLSKDFLKRSLTLDKSLSAATKNDSENNIIKAIFSLTSVNNFICETIKDILKAQVTTDSEKEKLTATEKIILKEIAAGKTTKEIAYEKNLSFHTVNTHRRNIFRKLEINNVHDAIKYALKAGIFDMAEYYI